METPTQLARDGQKILRHAVDSNVGTMVPLIKLSLLATVAYLVVNMVYNLFFHPLAKVPGPFWARASLVGPA